MRNITSGSPHHNTRSLVLLLLGLVLALGVGGCRRDSDETSASAGKTPPAPPETVEETAAVAEPAAGGAVDVSAVTAWEALARRLRAGERPPLSEYERLYTLPGQARAFNPVDPGGIRPAVLKNCSEAVFHPDGCETRRRPKRRDLVDNLAFLKPRLAALDSLLAELRALPVNERIMDLCRRWIPAERLPGTLNVRLFVGTPEIRYLSNGNDLLVDAGLALACGAENLVHTAAARLFLYFMPPPVAAPAQAGTGAAAVAAVLPKLHREGIAAWIERYPAFDFDPEHPILARATHDRADAVSRAAAAQPHLYEVLGDLLSDAAMLETRGRSVDLYLQGSQRYGEIGYAMAALVADRFGEHVLRETLDDPVAFLAAYQRAAAEVDRAPGQLALLHPLPQQVFEDWKDLYRREFPASARE